jgi:acylphosphatase
MKVRAHVFVSGRVQGVFFRSEMMYEAKKHDVKGWVRNLPDDRVEAVFEGEEKSIEQLVEFCKHGPFGAIVMNVKITWGAYSDEYENFEIRY